MQEGAYNNCFNDGMDEKSDKINIVQKPDVIICGVNNVIGVKGESIDEKSVDVSTNDKNKMANVIDVDKITIGEKCCNRRFEKTNENIVVDKMPDVIICGVNDVFGSDMNVKLQYKNIDNFSPGNSTFISLANLSMTFIIQTPTISALFSPNIMVETFFDTGEFFNVNNIRITMVIVSISNVH